MPVSKAFIDTNVLLYLLLADSAKADRAETILRAGGLISVHHGPDLKPNSDS